MILDCGRVSGMGGRSAGGYTGVWVLFVLTALMGKWSHIPLVRFAPAHRPREAPSSLFLRPFERPLWRTFAHALLIEARAAFHHLHHMMFQ